MGDTPASDEKATVVNGQNTGVIWNGSRWVYDVRLGFLTDKAYDLDEYGELEYLYKMPKSVILDDKVTGTTNYTIKPSTFTQDMPTATNGNHVIYLRYGEGGVFYGDRGVLNSGTTIYTADEYQLYKKDWSDTAYGNISNADYSHLSKTQVENLYGFCFDFFQNSWYQGDVYMDYIRVYRKGVTAVTYNTNAPAGATVIYDVPAETGRGVGTGYLLTGLRPKVEGYTFLGWANTPDATVPTYDVERGFDLTGDLTVYAVWTNSVEEYFKAENSESAIRSNVNYGDKKNQMGLRVVATFDDSRRLLIDETEMGFIVTRKANLDSENVTAENFTLNFTPGKFVTGISYNTKSDPAVDKLWINFNGDDCTAISGVIVGVPTNMYNDQIVFRSYSKFNHNGNEYVSYGTPVTTTVLEIARQIIATSSEQKDIDYAQGLIDAFNATQNN